MIKKIVRMALAAALFLAVLSCALPPDYAVREELYPGGHNYTVSGEKTYKVFRIYGSEALLGYMISIPTGTNEFIFLKATPDCMLDTALLYQKNEKGKQKYPIYQAEWGQNLSRLAERENLQPVITHFITNHYQRDVEELKKGSAFSLF